jgi:hypothetical protein
MRSHQDEGNSGVIDPDQWFKILLVYGCYQYTRSSSSMQKKKSLGVSLSSNSARLA